MKSISYALLACLASGVPAHASVTAYSTQLVKSCLITPKVPSGEPISYQVDLLNINGLNGACVATAFVYERNTTANSPVLLGTYTYTHDRPTRYGVEIYESKDDNFALGLDDSGQSQLRVVPTNGENAIQAPEALYKFTCK